MGQARKQAGKERFESFDPERAVRLRFAIPALIFAVLALFSTPVLAQSRLGDSRAGLCSALQRAWRRTQQALPLPLALAPFPESRIAPELKVLSRGDPGLKRIALTIDDGPRPGWTPEILALLKSEGVHATFFYVGKQCEAYPDLVRATAAAGHELGNHTYTHTRLPELSPEDQHKEIARTQSLLCRLSGIKPRFVRPPGGHRDRETEDWLAQQGLVVAMWDAGLNDLSSADSDCVLRCAKQLIRPGSVVLMHTGAESSLEALPKIIQRLRAQGYEFVTLSELADGLEPRLAARGRGQAGMSNKGLR